MSDSLTEQLLELEKERQKIIHESFVSKEQQIDNQMEESTEQLKETTNDKAGD